jgi:hypothetical protein
MLKKKIWANFQSIIDVFTQKLSISSQKNGFGIRDPEKNLFRIPDPGVKKAPDPGSRIRICNTAKICHLCSEKVFLLVTESIPYRKSFNQIKQSFANSKSAIFWSKETIQILTNHFDSSEPSPTYQMVKIFLLRGFLNTAFRSSYVKKIQKG